MQGGRGLWGAIGVSLVAGCGWSGCGHGRPLDALVQEQIDEDVAHVRRDAVPTLGTRRFRHGRASGIGASSDGKWVVTSRSYGEMRWFAYPSGERGGAMEIRGQGVAVASDAPIVAAVVPEHGISAFDIGSRTPRCRSAQTGTFELLAVNGAGTVAAAYGGLMDERFVAIDLKSCTTIASTAYEAQGERSLAVMSGEPLTVAMSVDKGVVLWRPVDGSVRHVPLEVDTYAVAAGPGGDEFMSAESKSLRVHTRDGAVTRTIALEESYSPRTLELSPDKRSAVIGTHGHDVVVVDLEAGAVRWRREGFGYDTAAAFDASGRFVLETSHDASVRRFDALSGEERPFEGDVGPLRPLRSIAMPPSGDAVYVPRGRSVQRLGMADPQDVRNYADAPSPIASMALSQDRTPVAVCDDGLLVQWNDDGTIRSSRPVSATRVRTLAAAAGGPRLAVGGPGALSVFDADEGVFDLVRANLSESPSAIAFSPDAEQVLMGDFMGRLQAWDVETSAPLAAILVDHASTIDDIVYDPTGSKIAVQADSLVVFDADSLTELLRVDGYARSVRSMAWSPDGTQLAISDDEGFVWRVDARTGEPLAAGSWPPERFSALAWLPEDRLLLARDDTTLALRKLEELDTRHELVVESRGGGEEVPLSGVASVDASPRIRPVPRCRPTPGHADWPACAVARLGGDVQSFPAATEARLQFAGSTVWAMDGYGLARYDTKTRTITGRLEIGELAPRYVGGADGHSVVVMTHRSTQVWDVDVGGPVGAVITDERRPEVAALDTAGRRLAVGYADGTVDLHSARGDAAAKPLLSAEAQGVPVQLRFSDDGTGLWILTDQEASLLDVGSGRYRSQSSLEDSGLAMHRDELRTRISTQGDIAVWSHSRDGTWERASAPSFRGRLFEPRFDEVYDASPSASLAVGLLDTEDARLATAEGARTLAWIPFHVGETAAISDDGETVAVAHQQVLQLLDAGTLRPSSPGYVHVPQSASLRGDRVVTVVEAEVASWSASGGGERVAARNHPFQGYRAPVLSNDGRFLAALDEERVGVFDTESGETRWVGTESVGNVLEVADDGQRVLVSVYRDDESELAVFDMRGGKTSSRAPNSTWSSFDLSADGGTLAVVDGDADELLVLQDGARRVVDAGDPEESWGDVALSGNGRVLVAERGPVTLVLDATTGALRSTVPQQTRGLALDHDGSALALLDDMGRVEIWRLEEQRRPRAPEVTLYVPGGELGAVRFDLDDPARLVGVDARSGVAWVFDLSRQRSD